MRETPRLGKLLVPTMTLLACIALPRAAVAQGTALLAANVANPEAVPPLVEPVTELPVTPAPQIDAINLFPNQGEISPSPAFGSQRFGYVLHGEVRASYQNNLFIQPRNKQDDFIFAISPEVAVGWGEFKSELPGAQNFRHRFDSFAGKDYVYVDYAPSYTWYAKHDDFDSFDQAVRLESEWNLQRLTLGLRGAYITQTTPNQDIGNLVRQKELTAAFTSRYDFSGKTTIEANAYYDGLEYDRGGVGSREWRNEDWLNYQISPKIKLGIGGTLATVEREADPTQTYEQARVRVIYEASEKFTLGLAGGAEWRQADGTDDRTDGTFELNMAWSPFDGTYIYLRGYRQSVTGNTDGSDYNVATGAVAEVRQRIFRRFSVDLAAGYENADYQDSSGSANFGRTDDAFFIRPALNVNLASWVNCEISGEYRKNDSSDPERGYDATTATVRFNLLF